MAVPAPAEVDPSEHHRAPPGFGGYFARHCEFDISCLARKVEEETLQSSLRPINKEIQEVTEKVEARLSDRTSANGHDYARLQVCLDYAAARIFDKLKQVEWMEGESDSLERERDTVSKKAIEPPDQLRILEEEQIALRHIIYMRYVFRHLRNLIGFVGGGFILSVLSIESYAFQSRHWLGIASVVALVCLGTGVGIVFAQMDRDAILSRITDTKTNELGRSFLFRMLQFGALPVFTVLATQFSWIQRLIFPWLQPALEALKLGGNAR